MKKIVAFKLILFLMSISNYAAAGSYHECFKQGQSWSDLNGQLRGMQQGSAVAINTQVYEAVFGEINPILGVGGVVVVRPASGKQGPAWVLFERSHDHRVVSQIKSELTKANARKLSVSSACLDNFNDLLHKLDQKMKTAESESEKISMQDQIDEIEYIKISLKQFLIEKLKMNKKLAEHAEYFEIN